MIEIIKTQKIFIHGFVTFPNISVLAPVTKKIATAGNRRICTKFKNSDAESKNEKLTEHLSKLIGTLAVIVISSFSFRFTMSYARKQTQSRFS